MDDTDINPTDNNDAASAPEDNGTGSSDVQLMVQLLESAQRNLETIRQMLADRGLLPPVRQRVGAVNAPTVEDQTGARIIEGTFDGQNMLGPDGKQYSVPANYASKSKLVEGDVLKLTITRDGSFIYKQIGPIERQRLIGKLFKEEATGEYKVLAGGQAYKVLLASITYFKGLAEDEVVILIPTAGEARWAAVENVIKQGDPVPDMSAPL